MSDKCPYCKEEINIKAVVCKSCNNRLYPSRQDMAIAAISGQSDIVSEVKSRTPYEAWCYAKYQNNKRALQECLDDAAAAQALAIMEAKMHQDLTKTAIDVIWGGGDIDPVPFELEVRKRFSKTRQIKPKNQ